MKLENTLSKRMHNCTLAITLNHDMWLKITCWKYWKEVNRAKFLFGFDGVNKSLYDVTILTTNRLLIQKWYNLWQLNYTLIQIKLSYLKHNFLNESQKIYFYNCIFIF